MIETRWYWKNDPYEEIGRQLRLMLADGRWTNFIYRYGDDSVSKDTLIVSESYGITELDTDFAVVMLNNQFLGYANDMKNDYIGSDDAGAVSEPAFAWDAPIGKMLMSNETYEVIRKIVVCIGVAAIVLAGVILFIY